jgi:hypothetical protein
MVDGQFHDKRRVLFPESFIDKYSGNTEHNDIQSQNAPGNLGTPYQLFSETSMMSQDLSKFLIRISLFPRPYAKALSLLA